jgi:hypothetical protein
MLRPTSKPLGQREQFGEQVLELLWSLWAEMGVPGWTQRHQTWSIDPEPLILFTALIGESDPRLRDEALRWCIRNGRYIASTRIRNLYQSGLPAIAHGWGRFAATVNHHAGLNWPHATERLAISPSLKTSLDDFKRPALISLRLRTTIGVSARSEILLYFVGHPTARASAADIAEVVQYSKRNVEKELEALRKSGMLDVERRRNRLEHYVSRPEGLLLFAGPRPEFFPRWDAIFNVLAALIEFEARVDRMEPNLAAVDARRFEHEIEAAVRLADLPAHVGELKGGQLLTSLRNWGSSLLEALAQGDAGRLGWVKSGLPASPEPLAVSTHGVRTVVSPLLATATDLEVWADTRVAQERTPELIRSLIRATSNELVRLDMGAGEAIQYGGYDGIVESRSASPFVPEGRSVWEIGVGADVKAKADGDYDKRTSDPQGLDPLATTFVFVTPRRWASKRAWEKEHGQRGQWRAVRMLDGEDLETWLGLAPAVHSWLSAVLGKSWGSVQDLESYWSDWSEATRPPLTTELVLAGRSDEANELRKRIEENELSAQTQESPRLVRVRGDSADEALAFIAAVMRGMERANALLARSLVIQDISGWNWLVGAAIPLVLIPRFENPSAAQALRQGHAVLIPVGREDGAEGDLILPRLRREAAKAALLQMGLLEPKAAELATRGRASLISLRRKLSLDRGLVRPAWAHRVEAPALLPALLAGAWSDIKRGDQEVISMLADRPYQDVERSLVRWAQASDPPVRKVGSNWFLVSKEDAWDLLAAYLTRNDLERFREVLLSVLGIQDPSLDLPLEKQWMASVLGREHPVSGFLREGLVDTLAVMGARSGDETFFSGQTGQAHANDIVSDLLQRANAEATGKLWASLSSVLPLMAEAAPEPFLNAVGAALSGESSQLLSLFTDAAPGLSLFAGSRHTGLLWALENLAWSSEFMPSAVKHLAVLARLNPGGTRGNRPSNSLRSIFLIWCAQTVASVRARLEVLDQLRKTEPDVAWDLMQAMLPKSHDVAFPSHELRWRDWKEAWHAGVSFEERDEAVREVTARLLGDAGTSGKRWGDLIRLLSDLPSSPVIEALERIAPESLPEEDRTILWTALRPAISNYRRFADADWALPSEAVERLETVYNRLTPTDTIQRVAWLFTQRPDLLEGEPSDGVDRPELIDTARAEAIRSVLSDGGTPALLSLARVAEQPGQVGQMVARITASECLIDQGALFDVLDESDHATKMLARGYVFGCFQVKEWGWANYVLTETARQWAPGKRAAFLAGLPFAAPTWDWAAKFGNDTEGAYWSTAPVLWLDEPTLVERAAEQLVQYGRADEAVGLLGMAMHRPEQTIDPAVVARALEELLKSQRTPQHNSLAYEIGVLLEYLERSETVEVQRVALLEFEYLPVLEGSRRPARMLHRELAGNPQFFIDILKAVFRGEDEEPREPTDSERTLAMLGYRLLDSWHRPPGLQDDGTIDGQQLNAWVDAARALAAASRRGKIADQQIGRILRWVPDDLNGVWPGLIVRDVVERIESRDLEMGLELGLQNSRGVTSRGLTDGGAQERALQAKYLGFAQEVGAKWPRSAAIQRRIARAYAEQARMEDEQAEITEDRWR